MKKWKNIIQKEKYGQESRCSHLNLLYYSNSYLAMCSINKLGKFKAGKSMLTFDFSTLYTKIPHGKQLYVFNKIANFAFKGGTRKSDNILRFIDDLIAVNNGNEFENYYNKIFPAKLILKKRNTSNISFYDKRNSYNLNSVICLYNSSTIPSKMFFEIISAEILRIC